MMLVIKILLGLFGLGLVVCIHEAGHFIAARLTGIDVEAFSIGWGKALLKKKIGSVEYRLGAFPIGGYCKMRGEDEFRAAYENRQSEIPRIKGTYYGAGPLRRMLVCFAGPFFNLVFAVLVFSVIWGAGFEISTLENRIVLASDVNPQERYPADEGGLKTGDRIIAIAGKNTAHYHDIQEAIASNPDRDLAFTVEREGETLDLLVRPSLDKSTGTGKIGVYFWTDPLVSAVVEGSPAAIAGIRPGDRITRVNDEEFRYSADLYRILRDQPPVLSLEFERDGQLHQTGMVLSYTGEGSAEIGISYQTIQYRSPPLSPVKALLKGVEETRKTLVVSLRSFALLFRGIDLTQAVSGPVRITYMVGDVAAEGFGQSFVAGISSMANFLALISIALGVMNLLPLPVLDGGMILLFIIEIFHRRPLHPKAVYAFQAVGAVLIFGLMIFAVFGDILFLTRR
jgi:regulator of sigma E protease